MLTGWRDFDDTLRTLDLLHRRIDRAFFEDRGAQPWDPSLPRRRARAAWPALNVFENKEAFVVKADVPGLGETDVSVTVEDEILVVRGERKSNAPDGYKIHVRERAAVAFARKLPLPARVDIGAVSAVLKDGVLTITLPKSKEALPRQIAVKAS
jgi:HSP20 family protein